ncbi:MAG: hypothetical protein V8R63_09290 [Thomasclavelia ramosa]
MILHIMVTTQWTWLQMFGEWGGSGVTIGLVISILVFSKREDNRAIATYLISSRFIQH